jgi:hypothetical protein
MLLLKSGDRPAFSRLFRTVLGQRTDTIRTLIGHCTDSCGQVDKADGRSNDA